MKPFVTWTKLIGALALGLGSAASAQDDEQDEVDWGRIAERVDSLAFDPRRFFGDEIRPAVTVTYKTNVTWPVYSIAIARGCLEPSVEDQSEAECRARWTARMLRAPVDSEVEDPRGSGRQLLDRLVQDRITSREEMRDRLDSVELEWLEADLNACPTARTAIGKLAIANWIPEGSAQPLSPERLRIYIHPPIVELVLDGFGGKATFRGPPDEGTPGEWAEELYDALVPCWERNYARRPWER